MESMTETTFEKSVLTSGLLHFQPDPLENLTSKRKKKYPKVTCVLQPGSGVATDRWACGTEASTCPVTATVVDRHGVGLAPSLLSS